MPPDHRPFPRFIADNSQEGTPYGRFADRLADHFRGACVAIEDLPSDAGSAAEIEWHPERAWGGRVWVPATSRAAVGEDGAIEYFGHVSYIQPTDGDAHDFRAKADFTDVFAEDYPDWQIDLNDEVIGRWQGEASFTGAVTLIWGRPMVQGAVAVTAELEGNVVDQEAISGDRFSLIACDNMGGFGDPVYVEIKLWSRRGDQLAAETLYEPDENEDDAESDGEGEAEGKVKEPASDGERGADDSEGAESDDKGKPTSRG